MNIKIKLFISYFILNSNNDTNLKDELTVTSQIKSSPRSTLFIDTKTE